MSGESEWDSFVPIMIGLLAIFAVVVILNYKMKKNRTEKYLDQLQNMGIKAKEQKLDLSPLSRDVKKSFANGIKIFGFDINYIIITTHYNELYFWFNYVVNIVSEQDNKWVIKTVYKKEGFLIKKVIGFEWKVDKEKDEDVFPVKLVNFLNKDANLNKYLLERFQSGMPEINISPFIEDPIKGIAIRLRFVNFGKGLYYSSKKDFELYNTIAKYIKEQNKYINL